jgi:hypothetical protein
MKKSKWFKPFLVLKTGCYFVHVVPSLGRKFGELVFQSNVTDSAMNGTFEY